MTRQAGEPDDQAYFHAVEEIFIRLRGAPLLLSPADWRTAQSWSRAGIPLELVEESLETVFRQREERGAKGRVQSLRYCRNAVESAWEELQELVAPSRRDDTESLEADARLQAVADALPEIDVVEELDLRSRIVTLGGSVSEVERSLQALEGELYGALIAGLDDEERATLDLRVDSVLDDLPEPLYGEEREVAADRLRRQVLRRRSALPHLTLFE